LKRRLKDGKKKIIMVRTRINKNNNSYLSTQSYKLFSESKTPLEVSIALNLRESEATEFYKNIGS
jgi:hypothetical protein